MDFMVCHKKGSALILMLCFLLFLTVLVGGIMRMTVYGIDIVNCRGQTIAHHYALEALLLYGIEWLNAHMHVYKTGNNRVIYEGPWFENKHKTWHGIVTLTVKNKKGICKASLFADKKLIGEQQCRLIKDEDTIKMIR